MRGEIRRIHQNFGLTTVYVTHDQEEALSLADRLVVLHDGRVSQIGTPAELYEHPADAHVAAFMGYRNLLPLTVTSADAAGVRAEGSGLRVVGTPVGADSFRDGEQVLVAIRPEDLRVAAEGETWICEAVAEIVEYHGRVLHVEAATREGQRLHLKAPQAVRPGDVLTVAVDADRALVFRAGAAQAAQLQEEAEAAEPQTEADAP
jgi:putative spermidine/putrescine transport system ATP-binding protein